MEYKTRIIIGIILIIMGIGVYLLIYPCALLARDLSQLAACGILIFYIGIPLIIIGVASIFRAIKEAPNSIHKQEQKLKKDKKTRIKKFKIAFPYYCDHCKKFTYALVEYCENCGAKNTIRDAKKEEYQNMLNELSNKFNKNHI